MMENVEYKNWFNAFWGIGAMFFWSIAYFNLFKKPIIRINSKLIKDKFSFTKIFLFLIGCIGWLLLSYSMTYPRIPQGLTQNHIDANDIFIVVDVSRSMLAEDFNPNRLEAAKEKIIQFAQLRPKDRIGIIIFSEKVFTLLPLSTDLNLVKEIVSEIQIGPLGSGTNIGDALGLAVGRAAQSLAKNKVIILLTDGVSNVGNMTPIQAAEEAKKANIKIYSIGIGGNKDAKIPVGRGIFGMQYQNIPGGSIDIEGLQKISEITNGKSYIATDPKALENVLDDIQKLEKTKIEVSGRVIYKEIYYPYLLYGVLMILLVEILRRFVLRESIWV